MYPAELKYTKDHEWVKDLGDGTALVGITHFAQDALGDVVFVQLPEEGSSHAQHDEFGTVESVKTVSELFMPMACEVVDVRTSGDTAGDRERVVGYGSFAFTEGGDG